MLAKLFARGEKTTDLYALLGESDVIILPEVEPVFRATGQYSALCKMYSKRGQDAELLEVWSRCAGPLSTVHVRMSYAAYDFEPQTCRGRVGRS